jgi:hypothetical protein
MYCGPRDCIHNYPPRLAFMASWITTKQLLRRQDAKSLHTRNRENDVLGNPMGNMDILWAQQCITTAVKISTSWLQLANASWTHSSFFLTIIRCHRCLPLADCSWRPTTCQMHYKTLIRGYHSLTSGMPPSQRSQHWQKFANSNSRKFTFPSFQLPLTRSLNAHPSPNHPIQY